MPTRLTILALAATALLSASPAHSASGERMCVVRKYFTQATYPCKELTRDKRFKYLACPCHRLRR